MYFFLFIFGNFSTKIKHFSTKVLHYPIAYYKLYRYFCGTLKFVVMSSSSSTKGKTPFYVLSSCDFSLLESVFYVEALVKSGLISEDCGNSFICAIGKFRLSLRPKIIDALVISK